MQGDLENVAHNGHSIAYCHSGCGKVTTSENFGGCHNELKTNLFESYNGILNVYNGILNVSNNEQYIEYLERWSRNRVGLPDVSPMCKRFTLICSILLLSFSFILNL